VTRDAVIDLGPGHDAGLLPGARAFPGLAVPLRPLAQREPFFAGVAWARVAWGRGTARGPGVCGATASRRVPGFVGLAVARCAIRAVRRLGHVARAVGIEEPRAGLVRSALVAPLRCRRRSRAGPRRRSPQHLAERVRTVRDFFGRAAWVRVTSGAVSPARVASRSPRSARRRGGMVDLGRDHKARLVTVARLSQVLATARLPPGERSALPVSARP
jgi:hypothetical protein